MKDKIKMILKHGDKVINEVEKTVDTDNLKEIIEMVDGLVDELYAGYDGLKCDCYEETQERRYLTDFQRGAYFATTGKLVDYVTETVSRCRGTKECDICSCGGNTAKCDFYPYKRKANK